MKPLPIFIILFVLLLAIGVRYFNTSIHPPTQDRSLVAYFPFNGNAQDMSGFENHGHVHGAELSDDRFGNKHSAYQFNGIDTYIAVPHSNSLEFESELTITAWAKVDGTTGTTQRIITKWTTGSKDVNQQLFAFYYTEPKSALRSSFSKGTWLNTNARNFADGYWHFVATTYNGRIAKLYLDGHLIDEKPVTAIAPESTSTMYIGGGGAHRPMPVYIFKGSLDDIRIYNRALSDTEVQALFQEGGY